MWTLVARIAGVVCLAWIALVSAAQAQTQQLKLATFGPPSSYFYVEVILPWAEAVAKDSSGTIEIKHFGGGLIAGAGNMYDSVLNGAADIGWSITPSSFRQTGVIELPFAYDTGEEGAVALWRIYEKGLLADDYKAVKVFGMTAWPGTTIASRKPISKLEDFKGLKVAVSTKRRAETIGVLGAVPVSIPTDQAYEAVDRGVVDAAWSSHTATRQFKLYEVAKHWLDVSLAGGTGFLIMKKERFDALPPQAQAALLKHSGESLSRALGKSNDGEITRALSFMKDQEKTGKVTPVAQLSAAELSRWKAATASIGEEWAKSLPNGAAIRDEYANQVANVRAGK